MTSGQHSLLQRLAPVAMAVAAALTVSSVPAAVTPNFILLGTKPGSQPGQFGTPRGICVTAGRDVYVVDSGNGRIQQFGASGRFVRAWRRSPGDRDSLLQPTGICTAPDGAILVSDSRTQRVIRFSPDGGSSKVLGAGALFRSPRGIAVDPEGRILVVDGGTAIVHVLGPDGASIRRWGRYGKEKGEFQDPNGIAVDRAGNVYVADTGNDRIQKFTSTGTFVRAWSDLGADRGRVERPRDLALGPNGEIYFTQEFDYRIHKLDPREGRIWSWATLGMETFGRETVWSEGLWGIAADSIGSVYVTDPANNCVHAFLGRGAELTAQDAMDAARQNPNMWHGRRRWKLVPQPQSLELLAKSDPELDMRLSEAAEQYRQTKLKQLDPRRYAQEKQEREARQQQGGRTGQ